MIHHARLLTLACASLLAASTVAGPVAASPQWYTFTKIADNSGAPFLALKPPSINDSGAVAFRAIVAGGGGIFTIQDGVTTPIALSSDGNFCCFGENPAINAAGTVAFIGNGNGVNGFVAGNGIYTGSGGPIATIVPGSDARFASHGFDSGTLQINAAGTVIFALADSTGIYTGTSGGGIATVIESKALNLASPYVGVSSPAINATGSVGFRGNFPLGPSQEGRSGIYTAGGGTLEECFLPMFPNTPTGICPDAYSGLAINASGAVAYKGLIPPVPPARSFSTAGIYTSNGATIAEGPIVPDFQNLSSNKISMNASGAVLFFADFAAGSGLYVGPDASAASGVGKLIAIGDALFGSTVTQLLVGTGALNEPARSRSTTSSRAATRASRWCRSPRPTRCC